MKPEVTITEMTRKEIADRLSKVRAVIIPVASTEQHGLHLPLQHDTAQCCFIAEEAAGRLYPKVLVAPPVSIGLSSHHLRWPMSLTLRPETFVNVIIDICTSLKHHGVERAVILNGHGGNRNPKLWGGGGPPPIELAAREARGLGLNATTLNWFDLVPPDRVTEILQGSYPGHSGETETSLALYMYPDKVRQAEMKPCEGISDDVGLATMEKGKSLFEEVVKHLVSFLQEFMEDKIDDIYYHPHGLRDGSETRSTRGKL